MRLWSPQGWKATWQCPAVSLAHVTARVNLEEVDLARGPTDLTYGPITGVMDMVRYVHPPPIHGRLATSVIIRHLTAGPMIRTFTCAVSAAALAGPMVPNAPEAE